MTRLKRLLDGPVRWRVRRELRHEVALLRAELDQRAEKVSDGLALRLLELEERVACLERLLDRHSSER